MGKPKINKMPGQTYFAPYVLLALHNLGGKVQTKHAIKTTLSFFDVSDKIMGEKSKTRKEPLIHNRIRWARNDLYLAGFIGDSDYGYWQLTENAKKTISLCRDDFSRFSSEISQKVTLARQQDAAEKKISSAEKTETIKDDTGEEGLSSSAQDLEIIKGMDSFAFERLCAQLFTAVGYEDVENTKKTGDGGFDGVGYLPVGLARFKVAFESKQWGAGQKVGKQDMQRFLTAAKTDEKADNAVFITTSDFTKDARAYAALNGIELINGEKLVELLYKHDIGCVKRLDKGYFDAI